MHVTWGVWGVAYSRESGNETGGPGAAGGAASSFISTDSFWGIQFSFQTPGPPRASQATAPVFFLHTPFGVSSFYSGLLLGHPASFFTDSFSTPGQDGDVWTAEAGVFPFRILTVQ